MRPTVVARAHHGSVSKEQRALIEEDLKAGRLPAVVATSSLELGIDMGAIDLVIQVETPPSVASGLQRVGRAGHQVGAVSRGIVFPKFRGDLVSAAVVTDRMRRGEIETLRIPRNPLDVLAQQVVACVSMDDWTVSDLLAMCRRTASFADLGEQVFASVLDMLAGRYPSDEFAELRPRLVWDRTTDVLTARPGAQRLAVTSGGTIPDRGLFAVFLVGEGGSRVGELDEEMVYESRVGDVIALGATSWRIEDITHDRVLVSPAPGQSGRLPFWHGDALGRPAVLGAAIGEFVRTTAMSRDPRSLLDGLGLDDRATDNLVAYLREQREATRQVPSDRTIVVERFRDELGDWRVVVHSPFGARVHAPWALALGALVTEQIGLDAHVMHADDGIVLRLPDTDDEEAARSVASLIAIDPDEIEALVTSQIGGSALFAARFRECAARALLLPATPARPAHAPVAAAPAVGTPAWVSHPDTRRSRSFSRRFASAFRTSTTSRPCAPSSSGCATARSPCTTSPPSIPHRSPSRCCSATSRPSSTKGTRPSPNDAPRRSRSIRNCSPNSWARPNCATFSTSTPCSRWSPSCSAARQPSPYGMPRASRTCCACWGRCRPPTLSRAASRPAWLAGLIDQRRAISVRIGAIDHTAAVEDAARLRDALGIALPAGIPDAFLEPVDDAVGDLVGRYARTHGPFTVDDVSAALSLPAGVARDALARLQKARRLVTGEFRPGG